MKLKRLAAPKTYWIKRKKGTWVAKVMPGPHKASESIPLSVLLRDLLKLTRNARETSQLLNNGDVIIDGVVRKNPKHPVGLMDVVSIPKVKKYYRIGFDSKGRIKADSIKKTEAESKLVKVINKIRREKDYQLVTHDGRTIIVKLTDGKKINTNDSLIIKLPGQEITKQLPLKKNCNLLIKGGQHKGENAKAVDIKEEGIVLKTKEGQFMLKKDYVFVVGD